MAIGPVQVIVFGFERTDRFRGEIVAELATLRGRGLIRLVDLFVAVKSPSGEVVATEMDDLTGEEVSEFGAVIGRLLGLGMGSPQEATAPSFEGALDAVTHAAGLDVARLQAIVHDLAPGTAVGGADVRAHLGDPPAGLDPAGRRRATGARVRHAGSAGPGGGGG